MIQLNSLYKTIILWLFEKVLEIELLCVIYKGAIKADARSKHCDAQFILIHRDILPFKPPKRQLLLFIPGPAVILVWLSLHNQNFVVVLNLDWTDSSKCVVAACYANLTVRERCVTTNQEKKQQHTGVPQEGIWRWWQRAASFLNCVIFSPFNVTLSVAVISARSD